MNYKLQVNSKHLAGKLEQIEIYFKNEKNEIHVCANQSIIVFCNYDVFNIQPSDKTLDFNITLSMHIQFSAITIHRLNYM